MRSRGPLLRGALLRIESMVVIVVVTVAAALGCRKHESPPPQPSDEPAARRIGIALGEPIDGLDAELRAAARERAIDLDIVSAHGFAAVQIAQVSQLLEKRVAALLLGPVAPDTLEQARAAASARQIPLIGLLRGDGKSGSWVGIGSATLARAAGERAGASLRMEGGARPRVVVVEDSRWPETTRRVEATLEGLESKCGGIDLPLRKRMDATPADSIAALVESLARLGHVDVLVAGDRFTTEVAIEGAARSRLKETLLVVGATDDCKAIEAARASSSRLLLVAWKREDLVRTLLDAATSAATDPTAEIRREVACELVGGGIAIPK